MTINMNDLTIHSFIGKKVIVRTYAAGVHFAESTGKSLDDTYTDKQIAKLVQGQFGAEKFKELVK